MDSLRRCLLASWVIVLFFAVSVRAQQTTISYQGAIANAAGAPADSGTYSITVSFYSDESGTQPLWNDTFETMVRKGIFNIALGSGRQLPVPSAFDRPIWVGTRIGGMAESRPLSRLSAVPMSMNVADSAITSAKLNADYISSISVNGEKVTGKASSLNIVGNVVYDDATKSLMLNSSGSGINTKGKGAKPEWIGDTTGGNYDAHGVTAFNTVAGGQNDTANGSAGSASGHASVLGGQKNAALGEWSSVGGGFRNRATGAYTTVAGGDSNTAEGTYSAVSGGWDNKVNGTAGSIGGGYLDTIAIPSGTAQSESFIGGGLHNVISISSGTSGLVTGDGVIGGGSNNTIHNGSSLIGSGDSNTLWEVYGAIGAGHNNDDSASGGFIGAGGDNKILGGDRTILTGIVGENSAIVSGADNTTTGNYDFIAGGYLNYADGDFTSIDGGYGLKLGDHSFGFNGAAPTTTPKITDLSGFSQVAYFGNVNMMLGNVDNTARALQFYSPNKSLDYASDSAFYSSFQAASQRENIIYTLPDTTPAPGEFLKAYTVSGSNVTLSWDTVTGSGGGSPAGWLLAGNSGTSPGTNFLGTNDDSAFEIHVDNAAASSGGNRRVMRYEPAATSPNIIGGSSANYIDTGLSGASILSGGENGSPNVVFSNLSVIGGGEANVIDSVSINSIIGGGVGNYIMANYCVIGGGGGPEYSGPSIAMPSSELRTRSSRSAMASYTIPGTLFTGNYANSPWAVIGGGYGNSVWDTLGVVLGGYFNGTYGYASSILGGAYHLLYSNFGSIGGGYANEIEYYSDYSTIAGGFENYSSAPFGTVGGGLNNTVNDSLGTVSGGVFNNVLGNASTIGGGSSNNIYDSNATIGGGYLNYIGVGSSYSTIGGGSNNLITSDSGGTYVTIPGGDSLMAESFAQTVVGYNNKSYGHFTQGTDHGSTVFAQSTGLHTRGDDPLFIVGNGNSSDSAHRSNAFEVSYSGQTVVHHTLGGGRAPIKGGTYTDNVTYAWGDIHAHPDTSWVDSTFGVNTLTTITSMPGQYQILLTEQSADDTGNPIALSFGAVTATLISDGAPTPCGFITVTHVAGGFTVQTYSVGGPSHADCCPYPDWRPFSFIITGRN